MELFAVIDDTQAIVKLPKGVHKQVKLYHRRDRVYLPHGGGFVEVRHKQPDGSFTTGNPDVKLLEHDVNRGIIHERDCGQAVMRWQA